MDKPDTAGKSTLEEEAARMEKYLDQLKRDCEQMEKQKLKQTSALENRVDLLEKERNSLLVEVGLKKDDLLQSKRELQRLQEKMQETEKEVSFNQKGKKKATFFSGASGDSGVGRKVGIGAKSKSPNPFSMGDIFNDPPFTFDEDGTPIKTKQKSHSAGFGGGSGDPDDGWEDVDDEGNEEGDNGGPKKDAEIGFMQMAMRAINSMAGPKMPMPLFGHRQGQNPSYHVLRAIDWMNQHNIKEEHRAIYFTHTLVEKPRDWAENLAGLEDMSLEDITTAFKKHYSLEGRTPKQLCDKWDSLDFNPETDDIDQFISEVKRTAKQLALPEQAVIMKIKGKMPQELSWALTSVHKLPDIVRTVTEVFGKPHSTTQNNVNLHKIQVIEKVDQTAHSQGTHSSPMTLNSLESVLGDLTKAMQGLNCKPQNNNQQQGGNGHGRGCGGRGRGGRGRPWKPRGAEGSGRGGAPKNESGETQAKQTYDKSPTTKKPKVASKAVNRDDQRCHGCNNFGHWKRDCPEAQGNDGKTVTTKYNYLSDCFPPTWAGEDSCEEYEQGLNY